jgi:hypothetical protein
VKFAAHVVFPFLAALPLLAQNQVAAKDAALGRQLAAELRKRITPLESPALQQYVDRLGQKLAAGMPDFNAPFTFQVIAEDSCPTLHEPASFPGGFVFVPAALFLAARDEGEFAGMLAHAMAHGVLPLRRQTNLASVPLVFVGAQGGSCSAIPVGFVRTQWNFELQADALAARAMAQAGVDPQGLVRYVERDQPPGTNDRSPIPPRDQRVAALTTSLRTMINWRPRVRRWAGCCVAQNAQRFPRSGGSRRAQQRHFRPPLSQ